MSSPIDLLKTRRFLPLFLVQFLGAFNDNTFKNAFIALLTYRLSDQLDMPLEVQTAIMGMLFIFPFAAFSGLAGQISDGMDKAKMMRAVKFVEIILMVFASIGYFTQQIEFLYFVLFLMGTQSAFFAPIKYSVLPNYVSEKELIGANGLIQAATFLAILLGTIAGIQLILTESGIMIVSVTVVVVAIAGFIASLQAPDAPAIGIKPKVDWVFPRLIWKLLKRAASQKQAFITLWAIAWFWFVGAGFMNLLPAFAKEILRVNEDVYTFLLAGFSIGIGIGAYACSKIYKGDVKIGIVPWGTFGIAFFAIDLWIASSGYVYEGPLKSITGFMGDFHGWRIFIDFIGLAICSGIYVTPLNAILQVEAPEAERGRFIACSNILDAGAMVFSAIIIVLLGKINVEITTMFLLYGLTGLPAAVLILMWRKRRG